MHPSPPIDCLKLSANKYKRLQHFKKATCYKGTSISMLVSVSVEPCEGLPKVLHKKQFFKTEICSYMGFRMEVL